MVADVIQSLAVPWSGLLAETFSQVDVYAACIILLGVLCHFARRRLPVGLGTSVFACATTVGASWAAFYHNCPDFHLVPQTQSHYLSTTLLAAFCALWGFFGWWAARCHARHPREERSSSSTFFAWALVSGIGAVVLLFYVLFYSTWARLLNPDWPTSPLTAIGLLQIASLILAVLFWVSAGTRLRHPAILLILCTLAAWWGGLMIPSTVGSYMALPHALWAYQPAWWTWTFQMQIGFSVVLVGAAVLHETRYRAKRRRAWPDRLDDLVDAYPRWPGYIQIEAIIAAAILILGVYQIVRPGISGWQIAVASGTVTGASGITCLFMTYRRWSGNTAGLGLALTTLSVVTYSMAIAMGFDAFGASTFYAERIPILYNTAIFSLAFMAVFWRWLSGVWEQQLLDGEAWTTTGRLIPHALMSSFLITAIAVLIAFGMALWPRNVASSVDDDSGGRLFAGVLAIATLTLVSARHARKEDSSAEATQAVALIVAGLVFVFLRMPASGVRGWLIQYEAFFLGIVALPILVSAEVLVKTKWRCFSMPLWWLALFVLPMRSMILLLPSERLPAEWVRPLTLAVFGVLYLLAGCREHRRPFMALGAVLVIAAFV